MLSTRKVQYRCMSQLTPAELVTRGQQFVNQMEPKHQQNRGMAVWECAHVWVHGNVCMTLLSFSCRPSAHASFLPSTEHGYQHIPHLSLCRVSQQTSGTEGGGTVSGARRQQPHENHAQRLPEWNCQQRIPQVMVWPFINSAASFITKLTQCLSIT